jgi:hypothetical protein
VALILTREAAGRNPRLAPTAAIEPRLAQRQWHLRLQTDAALTVDGVLEGTTGEREAHGWPGVAAASSHALDIDQ